MNGIIVALIGIIPSLLTLIVSSITNSKVKKQQNFENEIKSELKKLDNKIDDNRKKELRSQLVDEYTHLINGKKYSKEKLQDIADNYQEYLELGGNRYVRDLHHIYIERKSSVKK
jgi:uncharacterized membrane protein YgaE (UPF0421/DUF939 family)